MLLLFSNLTDIDRNSSLIEPGQNANSNEELKQENTLPKLLPIGQVVLFDAICVIDTGASAVSKVANDSNKETKKGEETNSQINTNIEVKKVIYMIGTKVTKIDDCKIGGVGLNITGTKKLVGCSKI